MSWSIRQGRSDIRSDYFETTIAQDFFDLFCGNKIGVGISRHVYEHRLDKSCVVKIDVATDMFQNVIEWSTWDTVKEAKTISAWFAPCVAISPCGTVLLQKRAADVSIDELRKIKRVPEMLRSDLKPANWGRIGERIVCRDYGLYRTIITHGVTTKTVKAEWYD